MKKFVITITTVAMSLISTLPAAAAPTFKDVDPKQIPWAVDAIQTMASKGIIQGYEDGTLKPSQNVTKAELGMMLHRLFPQFRAKTAYHMPELDGHWGQKELTEIYAEHMYLGAGHRLPIPDEKEVIEPSDFLFEPDKPLTRWEVLLIINSLYPKKKVPSEQNVLAVLQKIKDVPIVRMTPENYDALLMQQGEDVVFQPTFYQVDENTDLEWFKGEALYTFHTLGIMTADSNGNFRPNDQITRAEMLTILNRLTKVQVR